MSDETYRAVEEALQRHVADENDGALLTAWTLGAAAISVSRSDETHYVYMNHDGPPHEWLGVQWMMRRRAMRWEAGEGE